MCSIVEVWLHQRCVLTIRSLRSSLRERSLHLCIIRLKLSTMLAKETEPTSSTGTAGSFYQPHLIRLMFFIEEVIQVVQIVLAGALDHEVKTGASIGPQSIQILAFVMTFFFRIFSSAYIFSKTWAGVSRFIIRFDLGISIYIFISNAAAGIWGLIFKDLRFAYTLPFVMWVPPITEEDWTNLPDAQNHRCHDSCTWSRDVVQRKVSRSSTECGNSIPVDKSYLVWREIYPAVFIPSHQRPTYTTQITGIWSRDWAIYSYMDTSEDLQVSLWSVLETFRHIEVVVIWIYEKFSEQVYLSFQALISAAYSHMLLLNPDLTAARNRYSLITSTL